jgi:mono/diheme cytochrome c family protein
MGNPRPLAIAVLAVPLLLGLAGCQQDSSTSGDGKKAGGDAARGQQQFAVVCATCHGPDGHGVKGLGKDLVTSDYLHKASDDDLVKLIVDGREANDPLNQTGVAMPPKGGNAALTDKDIRDIVAYVRTISK